MYCCHGLNLTYSKFIQYQYDVDEIEDVDEEVVDVWEMMNEREDPEDHEYREMFSTSNTGEDIVIPGEC